MVVANVVAALVVVAGVLFLSLDSGPVKALVYMAARWRRQHRASVRP